MTPLYFQDESADRREQLRVDQAALDGLMRSDRARFLATQAGRVRIRLGDGPRRLAWRSWSEVAPLLAEKAEIVWLGMHEAAPAFAVIPWEAPQTAATRPRDTQPVGDYIGLLQAAQTMPDDEATLAAQALALANWTNRCRHCGRCGAPMRATEAGHKRECTRCDWHEFPRTDPVVITLVVKGERCVLARGARFPAGFYAAVAGFVSPGETLEAAVRREVHEELGLRSGRVRYVGSQPWPFPSSLMIGFIAVTEEETFNLDPTEIADARWFERRDIARLCRGEEVPELGVNVPGRGVMARRLVETWSLG